MSIYELESIKDLFLTPPLYRLHFQMVLHSTKNNKKPCFQYKLIFYLERHWMMSNHGKMKEKLQEKRKIFRALCSYFFEQKDLNLQDLYVSSWSRMKKTFFNYYDKSYSKK